MSIARTRSRSGGRPSRILSAATGAHCVAGLFVFNGSGFGGVAAVRSGAAANRSRGCREPGAECRSCGAVIFWVEGVATLVRRVEVTIVCEECGVEGPTAEGLHLSGAVRDADAAARSAGWHVLTGINPYAHYCPEHPPVAVHSGPPAG